MDWKLFAATFGTLFAARSQKPWTVFLASSLALVLVSFLGVARGGRGLPLRLRRGPQEGGRNRLHAHGSPDLAGQGVRRGGPPRLRRATSFSFFP